MIHEDENSTVFSFEPGLGGNLKEFAIMRLCDQGGKEKRPFGKDRRWSITSRGSINV